MDQEKPLENTSSSLAQPPSDGQAGSEFQLPPQPRFDERVRDFFIGYDGLRPGWRVLLYLAMLVVLLVVFGWITDYFVPSARLKSPPVRIQLLGEIQVLVAAVIPAVIMARLEKRKFGDYGLPREQAFGKFFWCGLVWGIVSLSALMLLMRGIGVFTFGHLALHGERIFKFAGFWAVFFLLVGFFEEFTFRGYAQFTLSQAMRFWPSAGLLSLIFGGIHLLNAGEAWAGALAAGLLGLFFCLTLRRTGTIWFAVGMHASWDWSESFLYSVPDSGDLAHGHLLNSSFHGSRWLTGGSVGPEGSLLVFVIIALTWIVFDRVYPETAIGSTIDQRRIR